MQANNRRKPEETCQLLQKYRWCQFITTTIERFAATNRRLDKNVTICAFVYSNTGTAQTDGRRELVKQYRAVYA